MIGLGPETTCDRDLVLRAGPVSAVLDGCDLRYLRVGRLEIARRIHVAVRDPAFGTVPPEVLDARVEEGIDRFRVTLDVRHRSGDLEFRWRGDIDGDPSGVVRFAMDGVAVRGFDYNRIGFCILHPIRECAGQAYRYETPDGPRAGTLPRRIAPQRVAGGAYQPLFPAASRLAIALAPSGAAIFDFDGDLFEMEDQRNWTDASFKSYSPPLSHGFPHAARAGERLRQAVTVAVPDATRIVVPRPAQIELTLGEEVGPLPRLGVAITGTTLPDPVVDRLRALGVDHLRVDVHADDADAAAVLRAGAEACRKVGCGLELALFVTDRPASLISLRAEVAAAPVERVLVLPAGGVSGTPTESTSAELMTMVRHELGAELSGAPLAGGTDMHFCELNRTRPRPAAVDAICYPIVPQVHASDERSMVETLDAQTETVQSARAVSDGRPIFVSPVTLRARHGRTPAAPLPDPDPRQGTAFAAAWTLGSISALAQAATASITYFEAAGPRGIMTTVGEPTPVYRVLADIAAARDARVRRCDSSDPLLATCLALDHACGTRLLVANLTPMTRCVDIVGLPAAADRRSVQLAPHAVSCVDFERADDP